MIHGVFQLFPGILALLLILFYQVRQCDRAIRRYGHRVHYFPVHMRACSYNSYVCVLMPTGSDAPSVWASIITPSDMTAQGAGPSPRGRV